MLDIIGKLSSNFFHTCHVYKPQWSLSFCATFSDCDLAEGHEVRVKQNLLASFCLYFSADQDEIWCVHEAIQFEYPDVLFS